jgi:hypothetical protein
MFGLIAGVVAKFIFGKEPGRTEVVGRGRGSPPASVLVSRADVRSEDAVITAQRRPRKDEPREV